MFCSRAKRNCMIFWWISKHKVLQEHFSAFPKRNRRIFGQNGYILRLVQFNYFSFYNFKVLYFSKADFLLFQWMKTLKRSKSVFQRIFRAKMNISQAKKNETKELPLFRADFSVIPFRLANIIMWMNNIIDISFGIGIGIGSWYLLHFQLFVELTFCSVKSRCIVKTLWRFNIKQITFTESLCCRPLCLGMYSWVAWRMLDIVMLVIL